MLVKGLISKTKMERNSIFGALNAAKLLVLKEQAVICQIDLSTSNATTTALLLVVGKLRARRQFRQWF